MSVPSSLEFRILAGAGSGCRLPLKAGMYRAGGDDRCDILLPDAGLAEVAFVLYVGEHEVALEAVDRAVTLRGNAVRGLAPLAAGQVFMLDDSLFAVDDAGAPWPDDPVALAAGQAGPPPVANEDEPQADAPDAGGTAANAATLASSLHEDAPSYPPPGLAADPTAAGPSPARQALPSRKRPRRLPFWVAWLGGTAMFMVIGVGMLFVSLRPAPAASVPASENAAHQLEKAVAAARSYSLLKLTDLPEGGRRLTGHIETRKQRADLTRQLRAIDPGILVQISADEDLDLLVRDTLARIPGSDIQVASLRYGELTLRGHVPDAATRKRLETALSNNVPALRRIESAAVTADDDALDMLQQLLAAAGLEGRIAGRQEGRRLLVEGARESDAELHAWREIRRELERRFGDRLVISENFRSPVPAPAREDVLIAIGGAVPYVVLRGGQKQGRSGLASSTP